jgi:hypothetical protein
VDTSTIASRRLQAQRLDGAPLEDPQAVLHWLVASQAQDFGPALWSVGQRCDADVAALLEAFDAGQILRTHVLRPTWHFLHPADIRWVLALTAPRVHVANGYMYRQLDLDEVARGRAAEVVADALQGGAFLPRAALGDALAHAGIDTDAPYRLAYILMHCELEAVVCSGPLQGKQHTYALLDERVPPAEPRTHEEALAELVRRFVASRGLVTMHDLKRWSSLTMADVRRGFDLAASELERTDIDGTTYWSAPDAQSGPLRDASRVHLLQGYDEYLSSYPDSRHIADPTDRFGQDRAGTPIGIVVADGRVVARWRRPINASNVAVEVVAYAELDAEVTRALAEAADRHGAFLGLPVTVTTRLFDA